MDKNDDFLDLLHDIYNPKNDKKDNYDTSTPEYKNLWDENDDDEDEEWTFTDLDEESTIVNIENNDNYSGADENLSNYSYNDEDAFSDNEEISIDNYTYLDDNDSTDDNYLNSIINDIEPDNPTEEPNYTYLDDNDSTDDNYLNSIINDIEPDNPTEEPNYTYLDDNDSTDDNYLNSIINDIEPDNPTEEPNNTYLDDNDSTDDNYLNSIINDIEPDNPTEEPNYTYLDDNDSTDEEDLENFFNDDEGNKVSEFLAPVGDDEIDVYNEEELVPEEQGIKSWKDFKNKIKSEMGKESDTEEDPVEEEAEDSQKEQKIKKGGILAKLGILNAILQPIIKIYKSIVNAIISVIDSLLGILGSIPVIGKPFLFLKKFTKPIRIIANCIPLVILIIVLMFINSKSVQTEIEQELPDSGLTMFTNFEYNNGIVSGTVTNNGEVIAKVTPVFEIYTLNIGINPKSWVIPQKQGECIGEVAEIPVDETAKVIAECDITGAGLKVSGKLNY